MTDEPTPSSPRVLHRLQSEFQAEFLKAVRQLQKPEQCGGGDQVSNRLLAWVLERTAV